MRDNYTKAKVKRKKAKERKSSAASVFRAKIKAALLSGVLSFSFFLFSFSLLPPACDCVNDFARELAGALGLFDARARLADRVARGRRLGRRGCFACATHLVRDTRSLFDRRGG